MGLGHQQENAKTGCSGSTELPWLCCGVESPLHSLLPSLRRIQGRRKGGWQKALSRDYARGSEARLCLHHGPFHRHRPGMLSGAEHLTLPQLSPQTTQPTPPSLLPARGRRSVFIFRDTGAA